MSTALDLAALAAQGELKIPIARGVVSQGGSGTDYTGWSGVSSVFVEAKVEVREQSRGFATLTLTVEGSTNGSVWSTLQTFTFGHGGTQTATVSAPDDHLRVSWAVGGHSEWQIIEVTAAPSIIDTGGGGGSQAFDYAPDATGLRFTPDQGGAGWAEGIAFSPDSTLAYIAQSDSGAGKVIPVTVATGVVGTPIAAGVTTSQVAFTPDGLKAYATSFGDGTVIPITVAGGVPGTPIPVGSTPFGIAMTPDGTKAYVTCEANPGGGLYAIDLSDDSVTGPIDVGDPSGAVTVAVTPDGATAYVVNNTDLALVPVDVATDTPGSPIDLSGYTSSGAYGIAISPDGAKMYLPLLDGSVAVMSVPGNVLGANPQSGAAPKWAAFSPDGTVCYVVSHDETLWRYDVATDSVIFPALATGAGTMIAFSPDGKHLWIGIQGGTGGQVCIVGRAAILPTIA